MAKTKKSSKTKAAKPEVAPDVDEDEVDAELEELDEDEATEVAPTKKKGSQEEVEFGASDLAALLSEKSDKPISARDLRTLLRKMARDGRITREVSPGNRTRYSWSGPNDPEVKMIVKAVTGGELEEGKREALAKLKAQKAEKQAAKAKEAAKAEGKKTKKAKPAPVEVDDDDDELEDDDE